MNFILNNKLAIFLIFMIFYCLFNYHLQEGFEKVPENSRIIKNRKTGKMRLASSKEVEDADAAVANAMEARKVNEEATKELARDREISLSAKTPTQQKEATESSALSRKVEAIDGETGQETERAAAAQMKSIIDKPKAETGARGEALGKGGGMVEEAAAAARKLSEMAMASTMKDVARAQDAAIENLRSSVSQSKNMDKKLSSVAKSYGLADQGEGFSGVVGAGSEVSGSTKKSTKNSNEVVKQRDRVAGRLGCEERCKYLYDSQTGYICDSGNCICKVKKDKINFGGISAEEADQDDTRQAEDNPTPTKSSADEPAETKSSSEKPLHKGAVCVGIGDNKVLLKEWYDGNRMLPPSACASKCKEYPEHGCKFYSSRVSDNGACMLYSNCPKQRSDGGYKSYNVYTAPKFVEEKALHKGAVCVGIGDNKVLLKEWYAAQKWPPSACKAKCKETEGCKFYSSRLNDHGACMLYSNCPKQRSDGGYKGYNVYAVGDTEGFRSGFSIPEENKSKYNYRIHGKCDTTEINRGEA